MILDRRFGKVRSERSGYKIKKGIQAQTYLTHDDFAKLKSRARKNNKSIAATIRVDVLRGNNQK